MRLTFSFFSLASALLFGLMAVWSYRAYCQTLAAPPEAYFGFDRNDYPGDDALPILRKSFTFSSYWLGPPPGEKQSHWLGKRALLQSHHFGFVVLFNGKATREITSQKAASRAASAQALQASKLALQEGFPQGTVIFLDVEEGGRLTPHYHEYLQAWVDALTQAGFQAGVYCSGIPVNEGADVSITTADDIRARMGSRQIAFWVYNDACPPSPGGSLASPAPNPSQSGTPYATVWQTVRSPQEKQISSHCKGYAKDGNFYAPGDTNHEWFLDVNVAASPDPSAPKK
jgi:hypothetical protein